MFFMFKIKNTIFAAHKRLETLSRQKGTNHEKDSHRKLEIKKRI